MSDSFGRMTEKKSGTSMIISLFFLALIAAGAIAFFKYYERENPQISFHDDISILGLAKEVKFTVSDARSGIRLVEIILTRVTKRQKFMEKNSPAWGFLKITAQRS